MGKYQVVRGQKSLSGFYPNDISGVFAFRTRDWYSFETREDAEQFIMGIRKEINIPENIKRYGKYAKQHQSVARNLWVWKNETIKTF